MARFSAQVKLFVLERRSQGVGWKAIKERIEEEFHIDPPTTRAMQKWEKNLDRTALNIQITKALRREAPAIAEDAQQRLAQGLLPVLWQAKDAGGDMELAGWKWFFSLVESQLGINKFEYFLSEYMKDREKLGGKRQS